MEPKRSGGELEADMSLLRLLYRKEKALLERSPAAKKLETLLTSRLTSVPRSPEEFFKPERLILLLTHACQLRCTYCRVSKFSESMSEETMKRGIDLLLTSSRPAVQLQFFGGDPLLRFDLIQKAVERVERARRERPRQVRYMLTTNGHALDARKLAFLKTVGCLVEFSFDGDRETFAAQRPGVEGQDFYELIKGRLNDLKESGLPYYVIMVATPERVGKLLENFRCIAALGHKRVQINYQLGRYWSHEAMRRLLIEMGKVASFAEESGVEFINATSIRREPTVLNSELIVDVDGGIYRETGICLEEDFKRQKRDFFVTKVEDAVCLDDYPSSPFDNFRLLSEIYGKRNGSFRRIILNNIEIGYAVDRWVRARRRRRPGAVLAGSSRGPGALARSR